MRFILSAALAACLCSPAYAKPVRHLAQKQPSVAKVHESDGPVCVTPDIIAADLKHRGTIMARLDGDDAQRLLDAGNHEGSDALTASTVIVALHPDNATLGLFNGCFVNHVTIDLEAFEKVWAKARGVRV